MEQIDPQKILESLDSWEPVKAPPFFASRVMARWENLQEEEKRPFWQLWWKPALLVAATVINLMLIIGYQPQSSASQDTGLNALQEEYQIQESQSDDINLYNL